MSAAARESSVLGSSAVMAAGTVVSRLSGFVRNAMLAAAIGLGLHADVFNIANTIPNMLYILLAGGVFNAVLVPQLVRAMKNDADGGTAYTNRIITLAGLFLAGATAILIIAAPLVMRVLLNHDYFTPAHAAERESAIAFARLCLPQVFFYGMFVLVGQVLNARGRFGPMMWAPIANNVVAIATLGIYLAHYGTTGCTANCGYTGGQEWLLGLGSTLGIAVQFVILVPYLRAAGFRYRARFDFRDSGLGHTLRLGLWTVLFVVVNQIAYVVVVKVASGGPVSAAHTSASDTGYTIYSNAFLLIMVPHAIITVSLATATLPRLSRLASDADLGGVARDLSATLRTTYAALLPLLAVVPVVASDLAGLAFGYGRARDSYTNFVPVLSLFALGAIVYTTQYLALRGFYALEQNRRVFFNQCAVSATNIVLAIVLTHGAPGSQIAQRLVIAYTGAYLVGAALSIVQLRGMLGGLDTTRTVRFLVRMVIVTAVATGVAVLVRLGLHAVVPGEGKALVVLRLAVIGGIDLAVVVALSRLMRITEVTEVVDLARRRLRR
ncbi:MAG TPA: murein biosynthesis integral membrane protein MurJ [Marmoricola sp.]